MAPVSAGQVKLLARLTTGDAVICWSFIASCLNRPLAGAGIAIADAELAA